MKKIYLACPYAHPDESVRESRFNAVSKKAAELMNRGHVVFSPISHSVPIGRYLESTGHEFWMAQDLPLLAVCDEMWVLALPGWTDSKGIQVERDYAEDHGIYVRIIFE